MRILFYFLFALLSSCTAKSIPEDEDSVVSIYTTLPPTIKTTKPLDVYHQIANNLAERITSPLYKLFGFNGNKNEKKWETIELLDDEEEVKHVVNVGNEIGERDVEELSIEALKKEDNKPEKITLYRSYLPSKENLDSNQTVNEVDSAFDDEPFEFDDEEEKPKQNSFIYFFESLSSVLQLAWGAIIAYFTPKS